MVPRLIMSLPSYLPSSRAWFSYGFCRKVRFWGKIPKPRYQEFNDLQMPTLSKKQLCDRTDMITVYRSRCC